MKRQLSKLEALNFSRENALKNIDTTLRSRDFLVINYWGATTSAPDNWLYYIDNLFLVFVLCEDALLMLWLHPYEAYALDDTFGCFFGCGPRACERGVALWYSGVQWPRWFFIKRLQARKCFASLLLPCSGFWCAHGVNGWLGVSIFIDWLFYSSG